MTIKECYDAMGADYQNTLNRLHPKRDKHGKAFGRKGTEGINLPHAKRHNRIPVSYTHLWQASICCPKKKPSLTKS